MATHAYTTVCADFGLRSHRQEAEGDWQAIDRLAVEEANLLHARHLARTHHRWDQLIKAMQGLNALYRRQGRTAEWARLVDEITPDFADPATGQPLPGRHDGWVLLTGYRVRRAIGDRDWPAATRLLTPLIDYHRQAAADALATAATRLSDEGNHIHDLAASYLQLGQVQREQGHADCLLSYQQAGDLFRRIDDRHGQADLSASLGRAYLDILALRDFDRAEHYTRESLTLLAEDDRLGSASAIGQLGMIAYACFHDAHGKGAPATVLAGYLRTAAEHYHQALALLPADNVTGLAVFHHQLGSIYGNIGRIDTALTHLQQSIKYEEAAGNRYGGGQTRFTIALLLKGAGRHSDALAYARAALADFASYGPAATTEADQARQLIASVEQAAAGQQP